MSLETITVTVGGGAYDSWLDLSVHASFRKAARSFSFRVAAAAGASATNALFTPGTALEVFASGDLLVSGFVNGRKARFDKATATISIEGRAKGQDHIDSTATHATGSFQNMDPMAIGNALGAFQSRFTSDRTLAKIPRYQVTPGDTVFASIEDLTADQGMTLCGQPNGDILITDATQAKKHTGGLYEGQNIEIGESDFGDTKRHSETHVRGQNPRGHGDKALRQHAVASDSGVTRNRPEVHHHHGTVDDAGLKKRATDRRNRKIGHGTRARITTPWWRDAGGTLWTPGYKVWTQSDFLGLAQDMLVEDVTFKVAARGEGLQAHLGLVDPQAYGGQAGKGAQSGAAWDFDASGAQ